MFKFLTSFIFLFKFIFISSASISYAMNLTFFKGSYEKTTFICSLDKIDETQSQKYAARWLHKDKEMIHKLHEKSANFKNIPTEFLIGKNYSGKIVVANKRNVIWTYEMKINFKSPNQVMHSKKIKIKNLYDYKSKKYYVDIDIPAQRKWNFVSASGSCEMTKKVVSDDQKLVSNSGFSSPNSWDGKYNASFNFKMSRASVCPSKLPIELEIFIKNGKAEGFIFNNGGGNKHSFCKLYHNGTITGNIYSNGEINFKIKQKDSHSRKYSSFEIVGNIEGRLKLNSRNSKYHPPHAFELKKVELTAAEKQKAKEIEQEKARKIAEEKAKEIAKERERKAREELKLAEKKLRIEKEQQRIAEERARKEKARKLAEIKARKIAEEKARKANEKAKKEKARKLAEAKAKKIAEEKARKIAEENAKVLRDKINSLKKEAANFYNDINDFVKSGGELDLLELTKLFELKPDPKKAWTKKDITNLENLEKFMRSIAEFNVFEEAKIAERKLNYEKKKDEIIAALNNNLDKLNSLLRENFSNKEFSKPLQKSINKVKTFLSTLDKSFVLESASKLLDQSSKSIDNITSKIKKIEKLDNDLNRFNEELNLVLRNNFGTDKAKNASKLIEKINKVKTNLEKEKLNNVIKLFLKTGKLEEEKVVEVKKDKKKNESINTTKNQKIYKIKADDIDLVASLYEPYMFAKELCEKAINLSEMKSLLKETIEMYFDSKKAPNSAREKIKNKAWDKAYANFSKNPEYSYVLNVYSSLSRGQKRQACPKAIGQPMQILRMTHDRIKRLIKPKGKSRRDL